MFKKRIWISKPLEQPVGVGLSNVATARENVLHIFSVARIWCFARLNILDYYFQCLYWWMYTTASCSFVSDTSHQNVKDPNFTSTHTTLHSFAGLLRPASFSDDGITLSSTYIILILIPFSFFAEKLVQRPGRWFQAFSMPLGDLILAF